MKINIIDLKKRVEVEYMINTDLVFFKDYQTYQYFYTYNKKTLILFKYNLLIDDLSIEYIINLKDKDISSCEIDIIDERKKQISFSVYTKNSMNIYRYNGFGEYLENILCGDYDDKIILNDRYYLIYDYDNNYYLLDTYSLEIKEIMKFGLLGLNVLKTRLVTIEKEDYIIFINSWLDEYDCYLKYKNNELLESSGVYYIKLIDFIDSIKEGSKLKLIDIKEDIKQSYLFDVHYDFSIEDEANYTNYHLYSIDYQTKELYLYEIVLKENKLTYNNIDVIDLKNYGDLYNLFVDGPNLNICKLNNKYLNSEYVNIYPEHYNILHNRKESFTKSINSYNIFSFWDEDEKTNNYKSGIRIKDSISNDLFMEIIGEGKILSDGTILIIEKIDLRTYSSILEYKDNPNSKLEYLFTNMGEYKDSYMWLITDMEKKNKDMNCYNFLNSDQINEFIKYKGIYNKNIAITGFYKDYNKDSIIENYEQIKKNEKSVIENNQLFHPAAIVEILVFNSEIVLITEEKNIYNDFRKLFVNSKDFKEYNEVKKLILEDIKEILSSNNLDISYSIKIFNEIYKDKCMDLDESLEEDEIIRFIKEKEEV